MPEVVQEHLGPVPAVIYYSDIPSPTDNYWWTAGEKGSLEPVWCVGDVFPPKMADLLEKDDEISSDSHSECSTDVESSDDGNNVSDSSDDY